MNQYVTGAAIKGLRERKGLKQADLAEKLAVSDKAVSKWETGKGYPDITLLEPLAQALDVSIAELISGNTVVNTNVSANMARCKFYVCPVCGNVMVSTGEASISCHGVELIPLEAEAPDERHAFSASRVEDELFVQVEHPMTKLHYISFIAAVSPDRVQLVKLIPNPMRRLVSKSIRLVLSTPIATRMAYSSSTTFGLSSFLTGKASYASEVYASRMRFTCLAW